MNVYLRDIEEKDIDLLFKWETDEYDRKNSLSTQRLSYDEHCAWFGNMIKNPNCVIWILRVDDEDVAQIRLDIKEETAEIDYSVSSNRRGEGFGKLILQRTTQRVKEELSYIKKLVAKVKTDNIASWKDFEANGYSMICEQLELNLKEEIKTEIVKFGSDVCVRDSVLFLTNNINALTLYDWLVKDEEVVVFSDRLLEHDVLRLKPKMIISYNYRPIIQSDVIDLCSIMQIPILNLHISYLPWNKGVNPNYWSFVENTVKGVTIHKIVPEIDGGAILYRRELKFDASKETFASTYQKLNEEIVKLFVENWDEIKAQAYVEIPQVLNGTYHSKKDFEKMTRRYPVEWTENIAEYLAKIP